jgi:amino acid transporter
LRVIEDRTVMRSFFVCGTFRTPRLAVVAQGIIEAYFMNTGTIRKALFGQAIRTKDSAHQTISKTVGLAVFASDSLSSVAYAGGEVLLILAVLGTSYFWTAIPITVGISILLIILTFSYRQTIFTYPGGGGAYIVSRDNFGEVAAQVAGAALLLDYILTVAVSIASSVDQMASAFPGLFAYKVQIALLLVLFITIINLRGVKESGTIFAVPTYFFVTMMLIMIGTGLVKAMSGTLGVVENVPVVDVPVSTLSGMALAFVMLRAFSSGTTALTGVEAISNGITAFKPPASRNAAVTLMWDAGLLMLMFLGLGILGYLVGAQPSHQEVLISQVARVVFGTGIMRILVLISATVILVLAANTSFNGFPRLAALQASDGFLPKQFTFRGSPPCLLVGRYSAGGLCQLAAGCLPGQRLAPDPALCNRRFHLFHALAGRHGVAFTAHRRFDARRQA